MSRRLFSLVLAVLLVGVVGVPAMASPPDKFDAPLTFIFPDVGNELVVFINTDRASYCTQEVVDWEYDVLAWLEGGMVDEFPAEPVFTDGIDLVAVKLQETGQGALVGHISESDLYIETWTLDAPENRPFVGPCTDTDDEGELVASGSTSYKANDNDLFGSDTRGNSFGNQGKASLTDAEGDAWTYSWKFHVNSRCYAPEDGPPACLLDYGTLKAK